MALLQGERIQGEIQIQMTAEHAGQKLQVLISYNSLHTSSNSGVSFSITILVAWAEFNNQINYLPNLKHAIP